MRVKERRWNLGPPKLPLSLLFAIAGTNVGGTSAMASIEIKGKGEQREFVPPRLPPLMFFAIAESNAGTHAGTSAGTGASANSVRGRASKRRKLKKGLNETGPASPKRGKMAYEIFSAEAWSCRKNVKHPRPICLPIVHGARAGRA